jgi:hypothetical protein
MNLSNGLGERKIPGNAKTPGKTAAQNTAPRGATDEVRRVT